MSTKGPRPSVLVTGGDGQVGRELQRLLRAHSVPFHAPGHGDLDVSDRSRVQVFLEEVTPKVVIHAAAWTDVDGCEGDPERARRVNAGATAHLSRLCAERGIFLIYLSTDFVFDGTKHSPYEPDDPANPLSVYGKSKWEGEEAVRKSGGPSAIVRTSWVYSVYGRSFPKSILRAAAARCAGETSGPLRVVIDQVGSPTHAGDLAQVLVELLGLAKSDPSVAHSEIYHVANAGHCSWYEFAREILLQAGWRIPVEPITSAELGRAAPRPAYSVLSLRSLETLGIQVRPWKESLGKFLDELRGTEPELFP